MRNIINAFSKKEIVDAINKCKSIKQILEHLNVADTKNNRKYFYTRIKNDKIKFKKRNTYYTVEYWIKAGFSKKGAVEKVRALQIDNSKKRGDTIKHLVKKDVAFGKWIILSDEIDNVSRTGEIKDRYFCHARCECGLETKVEIYELVTGKRKSCHKCSGTRGEKNARWSGYKEFSGTKFNSIRSRAKNKNIEFNLTLEYLYNLFYEQDKKCAISGIAIKDINEASLDRVDNSLGYIVENVQWVFKAINIMRNGYTIDEFIFICKIVAENKTNYVPNCSLETESLIKWNNNSWKNT